MMNECPKCLGNDFDPFTMIPMHCAKHPLDLSGSEDVLVPYNGYISGSAEAGEDGRAWADVLHRDSPKRRRPETRRRRSQKMEEGA